MVGVGDVVVVAGGGAGAVAVVMKSGEIRRAKKRIEDLKLVLRYLTAPEQDSFALSTEALELRRRLARSLWDQRKSERVVELCWDEMEHGFDLPSDIFEAVDAIKSAEMRRKRGKK